MLQYIQQKYNGIPTFGESATEEIIHATSVTNEATLTNLPEKYNVAAASHSMVTNSCESTIDSFQELFSIKYEDEHVPFYEDPVLTFTESNFLPEHDELSKCHFNSMPTEENLSITELSTYLFESPADVTEMTSSNCGSVSMDGQTDTTLDLRSNCLCLACQPTGFPPQTKYISYDFNQSPTEYCSLPIGSAANGCEVMNDICQREQNADFQKIPSPFQQFSRGESTNQQSNVALLISGYDKLLLPSKNSLEIPIVPRVDIKTPTQRKGRKMMLKPAVVSTWRCDPCNRMFRIERGLIQHNRSHHSGMKPYSCNVCGKRYHDQQATLKHQQRHAIVNKPFKCDTCTRQYHHQNDLKRHVDLHHGVARYNCKYCGKAFDRDDHVKDHETSHENGTVKRKRRK